MDDDEVFEQELRAQLTYWQRVLYLQDWTIDIRVVRQWEMGDQHTLASCEWFIQRKDAIVRILHPNDLPGVSHRFLNGEECDYDISLVHELLHLHFAPFHKEQDEVAHEQAINSISRALVKVWREPHTETSCIHIPTGKEGYL